MKRQVKISRTLLEHQYRTLPVKEILDYYGICNQRLYNILDQLGIERKLVRNPRNEIGEVVITE